MRPVKTNDSNFTYFGPDGEIADLPCRLEGANTFCVLEPTEADRKLVAEGGHIRLGIYGARHIPPLSLQVVANAGPYERVPAPCDVCGKEVDDAVHGSGPETHAFRLRSKSEFQPQKFG